MMSLVSEGKLKNAPAAPVVVVFSGLDPSGGAGIQADIETLFAMGCHAAPLITALTVQDTVNVDSFMPVDTALLARQAEVIFADLSVQAIKIGMLATVQIVDCVAAILQQHPDLPVVLDPVLTAGGGQALAAPKMTQRMIETLLPQTVILTPNGPEARALAGNDNLHQAASVLLSKGCQHVFITGGHEREEGLCNRFYGPDPETLPVVSHWPRLAGQFHGTGCTLASAIAARLAFSDEPSVAVQKAEEFVYRSLTSAFNIGRGQRIPGRRSGV